MSITYFTGNSDLHPVGAHERSPGPEPYLASEDLIKAVNLAIFLQRPLLLEGESGCGKSRLARAVAHELGAPLYIWNIRSKTRYQEGLYEYDALQRLHDVNLFQALGPGAKEGDRTLDPTDVNQYIHLRALGQAFTQTDRPAVVLIDEIDKADLDFPNDLLTVLEKPYRFQIRETGREIVATHPPIVIITSNKEKGNLPAPFLRRCVYHFVTFPSTPEQLKAIVDLQFQAEKETASAPDSPLVDAAIRQFLSIRSQPGLIKLPGTSEFLDWLRALAQFETAPKDIFALLEAGAIPYRDLLFKLRADWQSAGSSAA